MKCYGLNDGGKEPLEKLDEYVNTIKEMGIEECIKVRQAALERFNKRVYKAKGYIAYLAVLPFAL